MSLYTKNSFLPLGLPTIPRLPISADTLTHKIKNKSTGRIIQVFQRSSLSLDQIKKVILDSAFSVNCNVSYNANYASTAGDTTTANDTSSAVFNFGIQRYLKCLSLAGTGDVLIEASIINPKKPPPRLHIPYTIYSVGPPPQTENLDEVGVLGGYPQNGICLARVGSRIYISTNILFAASFGGDLGTDGGVEASAYISTGNPDDWNIPLPEEPFVEHQKTTGALGDFLGTPVSYTYFKYDNSDTGALKDQGQTTASIDGLSIDGPSI